MNTILKAVQVLDITEGDGLKPGAYEHVVNADAECCGFDFRCPCGCGTLGYLPLSNAPDKEAGPHWKLTGTLEVPTLQPSVQQMGPCKWHGYLVNGEWKAV